MNRLAQESSPYLLQHKNNPVDWFPWGPEAFEKASKENKPIFLSIGYSTCHWCHVMERESFEDHEVADLMNRVFVNIKVDREERPDIDHVYMSVCQAMTGSGGWPLTIVMTPDKKPFFAGTYFAKTTRFGRPGMMDLVPRLDSAWKNQRDQVEDSAKKILEFIETVGAGADETQIEETEIKASIANSKHAFDRVNGGFGDAPKFPSPHNLMFLLRGWKRYRDTQLNEVITKTLHAMRDGGMYDQVGFGFHRYSVDAEWLVPHFEKMLYDQAMLSYAYLEAHQATGETSFAATAREVFEYVLRDLTSPEGAFYSAEDADSEGVEGKFYVWDYEELKANATAAEFKMLEESFGVQRDGNFTDMGEASPHNILHKSGKSFDESAWPALREKLLNLRSKRVRPHLDDKILADWNGLMIAALAKGAQILEDEDQRYLSAAKRAFDFVFGKMKQPDGRLFHRHRAGNSAVEANADDYAYLTWAALELYFATFEPRYLEQAVSLAGRLIDDFWDAKNGGLFFTSINSEKLVVRKKETYDGATPSANGVAMWNFLRLSRLTGNAALEKKAFEISRSFSGDIRRHSSAHNMSLLGLDFGLGPTSEVVVVGESAEAKSFAQALTFKFAPHAVVLLKTGATSSDLSRLAPFTEQLRAQGKKTAIYICEDFSCQKPTEDLAEALARL